MSVMRCMVTKGGGAMCPLCVVRQRREEAQCVRYALYDNEGRRGNVSGMRCTVTKGGGAMCPLYVVR